MAVGVEAEALVQQLAKNRALVVSDDAIADPQKHHAVAVSGKTFDGEQSDGDETECDDPLKVAIHIGLVDDVADQPGAESRAARGHGHQRERNNITGPMPETLLGEQSPNEYLGTIALIGRRC
jgi:hypothetical protein